MTWKNPLYPLRRKAYGPSRQSFCRVRPREPPGVGGVSGNFCLVPAFGKLPHPGQYVPDILGASRPPLVPVEKLPAPGDRQLRAARGDPVLGLGDGQVPAGDVFLLIRKPPDLPEEVRRQSRLVHHVVEMLVVGAPQGPLPQGDGQSLPVDDDVVDKT